MEAVRWYEKGCGDMRGGVSEQSSILDVSVLKKVGLVGEGGVFTRLTRDLKSSLKPSG